MRKLILCSLFCAIMSTATVYGQTEDDPNALTFRALFMDYQSQNGGNIASFKDYNNGFEVSYTRYLANKINLNVPLKIGSVQSHEDVATLRKRIIGLDAVIHYNFLENEAPIIPYGLGGIGFVTETQGGTNVQIPLGLGVKFRVNERAYFSWQSEYRLALAEDRNNLHHGLGFTYVLGEGGITSKDNKMMLKDDADGDGIIDDVDLCPQIAGPKELQGCPDSDSDGIADFEDACPLLPGPKSLRGCPDADGDGVSDNDDECPNVAGTVENNGCPSTDSDNDGVPDNVDRCPDVAGSPANNGCPMMDADSDGVPDDVDKCPNAAGPANSDGCPDVDNDGIPDYLDKCPTKAGINAFGGCPDTDNDGIDDSRDRCPEAAGPVSNNGCPEISQADQDVLELAMRAVQFDTGKATLKPESFTILSQIAAIMNRYPSYNLSISGHTDNVGGAATNQSLSERRAKACYEYLITQGVSSSRMNYAGFGESRPIADNNTLRGKTLNRRVEFNLIPR
ncbi:OmpA family protein [Portibacter marinus]|uniref:OmpA family protein n=1 Tax=Portibacter marinus TaxID=2898660 RepID=UPI001F180034|nr:OmpA family protein [Portibacter marinus]